MGRHLQRPQADGAAEQLAWLLCHRRSYERWTYHLSLLQRVRALLVPINYQLRLSTEQLLRPIVMHTLGHEGSWRALAAVVTYMEIPVLLSVVIHACSFRHQLLLLSLAVAQHAILGIPHQLLAVDLFGLRPKVADLCSKLHVLLDPTFPGQAAGFAPWQCSEATAGFTLMLVYLATCCLIPLSFAYHFEHRHKLQWLGSLGLRLQTPPCDGRHAASRVMQGWAACALAWSLMTLAHWGLRQQGALPA